MPALIESENTEKKYTFDAYLHRKTNALTTSQEVASESEGSQVSETIFVVNVGDPGSIDIDKGSQVSGTISFVNVGDPGSIDIDKGSQVSGTISFVNVGGPGSIDIDKGVAIVPILQYRPPYKKDNPFSHIDEFLDNEEKVHLFINHIKNNLIAPYRVRLAKRINDLFDFTIEDDPDGIGISADSLQHFIAFLQRYPELKYPDVVLSPERNIVSEWHVDYHHHFSVDFLPTGDVRFVIFRPNPKKPKKTDRLSGVSTWDCLYEIMGNNSVLSWAL